MQSSDKSDDVIQNVGQKKTRQTATLGLRLVSIARVGEDFRGEYVEYINKFCDERRML